MFKRLVYNEIIRVLNLNTQTITSNGKTQKLYFEGGYLLGIYPSGIPYAVKQLDPTTKFSYDTVEIIPVSEELSTETPSVNKTDRSDYALKYSIMFRSTIQTEIEAALEEFRDYFYTNKQFSLDGYVVSIKTTRGDKLPQVGMDGGHYFNYYTFSVYLTAIKDGYIKKDTDTFAIATADGFDVPVISGILVVGKKYEITTLGATDWNVVYGTTGVTYAVGDSGVVVAQSVGTGFAKEIYEYPAIIEDIASSQGNAIFSNATGVSKADNTTIVYNNRINVIYNDSYIENLLYDRCMNRLSKDYAFNILSTFNGREYLYENCIIVSASRVLTDNGVVIMIIDWAEQDE